LIPAPARLLLALLSLTLPALAADPPSAPPEVPPDMATRNLVDPLDGTPFQTPVVVGANGLGGWDSDGCTYGTGVQPRATAVATSPTTLYSARLERWGRPLSEEQKTQLLAALLPVGQAVGDARDLAVFQKYELAIRVGRVLGDPPEEIGALYLGAAWTVRDSIVGFLPRVEGSADAWKKLQETEPMVRALKDDRARTVAVFDMARLCHRGGFLAERDGFLSTVLQLPDVGLGARAKRDEFYRRAAEECRLLAEARDWLLRAIVQGRGTARDRAAWKQVIGEIHRRLGDPENARQTLREVEKDRSADPETLARARDGLRVLDVQASPSPPPHRDPGPSPEAVVEERPPLHRPALRRPPDGRPLAAGRPGGFRLLLPALLIGLRRQRPPGRRGRPAPPEEAPPAHRIG
jgi:hypothetical protein